MAPSTPAQTRIRFNHWYLGALSGSLGVFLVLDIVSSLAADARLDSFEHLQIAAWLAGFAVHFTGVCNCVRVSTVRISQYRDWVGRRVSVDLRPGDRFVLTDERAYVGRSEGF